MKTLKAMLTVGIISLAASAHAASPNAVLECIHDTTPVDGPYIAVELVRNPNGDFNVVMNYDNPWTPEGMETKTLATSLTCAISKDDPMLVYCYRYGSPAGESRNSKFVTTKKSSIYASADGTIYTTKELQINVESPLMEGEEGFSHDFPLAGCSIPAAHN